MGIVVNDKIYHDDSPFPNESVWPQQEPTKLNVPIIKDSILIIYFC